MDKVNENKVSLDQQLEAQLNPDVETEQYDHAESSIDNGN